MKNMIIEREPNMEDMKKNIIDAGGLFYQYRACSNNASTIYDIENIKHNVLYAQTPLNMNDPFDSKIGFCSEKFYEECINMMLDPMDIDKNLKTILFMILKYKLLGNLIEFVDKLNKLKQYKELIWEGSSGDQRHFFARDIFSVGNHSDLFGIRYYNRGAINKRT